MSMIEYIVKTTHFPRWLFDKGTRVVEVLNSLFLIRFMGTFLYDFEGILKLSSYKAFAAASSPYWWIGMGVLGVVQVMALVKTSIQSNQFSGVILIASAWVWGMVAATFIASIPSLTSATKDDNYSVSDTAETGGSRPHNSVQPSVTVAIWHRVA